MRVELIYTLCFFLALTLVDAYPWTHSCIKKEPGKEIKVRVDPQPDDIKRKIEEYLKRYAAVYYDVESIAKENQYAIVKGNYNRYGHYTCPSETKPITQAYYHGRYCYVVKPDDQCIPYAVCKSRECKGCKYEYHRGASSKCLHDQFRRFRFWIYCEEHHKHASGFYLIERDLPQCCSCYYYKLCHHG